jgi:hypothetical protein
MLEFMRDACTRLCGQYTVLEHSAGSEMWRVLTLRPTSSTRSPAAPVSLAGPYHDDTSTMLEDPRADVRALAPGKPAHVELNPPSK